MEGFCGTSKKLLIWSGFWFEGNTVKSVQKFKCFMSFSLAFTFVMLPELYFIYQERNDMLKVSGCISEALTNLLTLTKMIIVYRNRDKLRTLFNDMRETWQGMEITDEIQRIKCASMKRVDVLSRGFAYTYLSLAANFMLNPLITQIIASYVEKQSISLAELPNPIKISFPFEIRRKIIDFSTIYAGVFFGEMITLAILMGFDTLSICLMNFCGDLFKILAQCLRTIHIELASSNVDDDVVNSLQSWTEQKAQEMIRKLKEIIRRHNQFIGFSHRLEEILNLMMLAQYMSSTFMFCIVGFQLTILLKTPYDFSILMTYCICLYCQLFMFSWFGSYLTTSSHDVSLAAYEWEWFAAPNNIKKEIILIILRSHRPVGVTAAKFYYISIESFAKALSSAVSYFTLLQTIYEE
ncbi:odorant receptor 13a-like [Lutzomyia longipalpis]|uniref:odorant receptor 13a-like n=1 Tax=Lutzomyia longipalpis TaxID=7200 RepID=UPI002483CC15|nr:odorant receptor 13a-like [Lutzomyia longipalpis]